MMRLLFILLISFALPVHGFAALAVALPPCPMEHDVSSASIDETEDVCCCENADAEKNNTLCKSGQMCKTTPLFHAILGSTAEFPAPVNPSLDPSPPVVITGDAAGVWRPPRLL